MTALPEDDGDRGLGLLSDAWDKVTQLWRDDVTDNFAERHWTPLQHESRAYLEALRALTDLLSAADQDTNY